MPPPTVQADWEAVSRVSSRRDRLQFITHPTSETKKPCSAGRISSPDEGSQICDHSWPSLAGIGGGEHHEPVPTTPAQKGHTMASHQNDTRRERRHEMLIVLDWLDLNGHGIDNIYLDLLESPSNKRRFRAHYDAEPLLDEPDVFAFQIATLLKLRTDADFRRCAEQHFLLQYDRDEAAAAEQAAVADDLALLRRQHWGDDPSIVDAGRRLLALLRAGAATLEQYRAAKDRWGTTWKDLTTFRAHPSAHA